LFHNGRPNIVVPEEVSSLFSGGAKVRVKVTRRGADALRTESHQRKDKHHGHNATELSSAELASMLKNLDH
jgi:hypothetical protein